MNAAFVFGGFLLLSGLIAEFRHVRLCNRIVEATANLPEGLRPIETWLNINQSRKRRKLRAIVSSEPADSELRAWASVALKLEVLFYGLFVSGMIVMAVGAAMQS